MARIDIKGLLGDLTLTEQRDLVLTYMNWMTQQARVDIARGAFVPVHGGVETVTTIPSETLAQLDAAVATNDRDKSLRIGVTEILRGLPIMQRTSTGPQLNTYFRAHLPGHIFDAVYRAAGLEPGALRLDPDFPTDPVPLPA